jgi:hypothetical protein
MFVVRMWWHKVGDTKRNSVSEAAAAGLVYSEGSFAFTASPRIGKGAAARMLPKPGLGDDNACMRRW